MPINTIRSLAQFLTFEKLNLLFAYGTDSLEAFIINHKEIRKLINFVFLDCGIFFIFSGKSDSARNRYINLDSFKRFIEPTEQLFHYIANLDDDPDEDGTLNNLINFNELFSVSKKVLPVIHNPYDDGIKVYLNKGHQYICFGSGLMKNREKVKYIMNKATSLQIKVHVFGQVNRANLFEYPIFSCDSSGWAQQIGFGKVYWWNPDKRGIDKTEIFRIPKDFSKTAKDSIFNHPRREPFIEFLRARLGKEIYELLGSASLQRIVNVLYIITLEQEVNKIHRQKGFFTAE